MKATASLLFISKETWKKQFLYFILAIVVIINLFTGLFNIYGDGVGYNFLYQQLRERNWSFTIYPESPPLPSEYMFVPAGSGWSTYYQIGAPLVWALFIPPLTRVLMPLLTIISPIPSVWSDGLIRDGVAILALNAILAYVIMRLLIYVFTREFNFSLPTAVAAVLLTYFGLPSLVYTFQAVAYAHTVELFFVTCAVAAYVRAYRTRMQSWLLAGSVCVGFAGITRIDALIYLLPFAGVALAMFPSKIRAGVSTVAPALAIAAFQIFLWWIIFGTPLPSKEYTLDSFRFPGTFAWEVLFSPERGFFVWSPIALFGVVGLLSNLRKKALRKHIAVIGVSSLILYALFYGSWYMWWGGSSVGQRFLIPLLPFISFGVAQFLSDMRACPILLRAGGRLMIVLATLFYFSLALIYPLVDRPGITEEHTTPTTLYRNASVEYGFPGLSSWLPLLRDSLWFGPRLTHLLYYQK